MLPRRAPLPLTTALAMSVFLAGCGDAVPPVRVLAEGEYGITGIAVDEFAVYFIKQDGTLKRVLLDGGPAAELASGITDPRHVTVDTDDVYWATSAGTIERTSKSGAVRQTLFEGPLNLREMAADQAHLYFTENTGVWRMPKDIASPEQLVGSTNARPLARDGGFLYWGGSPTEEATTSDYLQRMTVEGDGQLPLAKGVAAAIAADPGFIFWGTAAEGAVNRVRHDGSDARVIAYDQPPIFKMLADSVNVYWSTVDGSITTTPVDGGVEPFVMSTGPKGPTFLAQDTGFLYSARSEAGTILMRPKPEGPYE